jgi:hypothetical protein
MNKSLLKAKIEAAEQQLALAEEALAVAIRDLRAVPRAEKTITTRTIEDALHKLEASRSEVSSLKALIDSEDGA